MRLKAAAWVRPLLAAGLVTLASCSAPPLPGGSGPDSGASPQRAAAPATLDALQHALTGVVQEVAPSVVEVQAPGGLGSGVIFDSQGDIVTNGQVVGSARDVEVTLPTGQRYEGHLVGAFAPDDLAVVRIGAQNLRPATFGDSGHLEVGDLVVAMGNPLGLASSVTEGIVSAVGRTVNQVGGGPAIPGAVQISAAVNPGNSGGAVANLFGQVVGIPTLAVVDPELGGAEPGIGFAISSEMVRDIASQILQYGHVVDSHRAYLGIDAGNTLGLGALVVSLVPGGPAAAAGIRTGELVTDLASRSVTSAAALAEVLADQKPGQRVPIRLLDPDGTRRDVTVTLGEYPSVGGGS